MCLSAGPECQKSHPRSTEISVPVKASSKVLLLSESIVLSTNLIIHREGDKFNHLFLPCFCSLPQRMQAEQFSVLAIDWAHGTASVVLCTHINNFSLIQRSLFLSYLLSSD